MIRRLAQGLLLFAAATLSVAVSALGLGEAELKSALNEPLNAEIELVNIGELTREEILPGLASREDFQRTGIDRVFFLTDLRFNVVFRGDRAFVEVTSSQPVREPFLNFLVEVIWPSGRLLREYALLVDPPAFTEEKAQPVQAPVAQAPRRPVAPTTPPQVTAPNTTPSAPVDRVSGDNFGPVKRSDTLWNIALQVRPDRSVSPQQTMLAIQDLNPDAFFDGNINRLKTGSVLRLPSLEQIRGRSARQALREVAAQNRNQVTQRQLSADTRPAPAPIAPLEDTAEVRVVAPGSDGAEAGSSIADDMDELQDSLSTSLERLDKVNLENEELRSRVQALEDQLNTLQRLITLQDDSLSAAQQQAEALNEAQDVVAEAPEVVAEAALDAASESATEAPVAATDADIDLTEPAPEPVTEAPAVEPEPAADTAAEAVADAADSAEAAEDVFTEEAPSAPVAAAPAAPARPVQPPAQKPMDLVGEVLANPLYLGIAGGAVVLLLVLLLLISRRNARREQAYLTEYSGTQYNADDKGDDLALTDSYDSDDDDTVVLDADKARAMRDADSRGETVEGEESASGFDPETDDPIAEADIYIAYGRLDQAEQLLNKAIQVEPERADIRLKLAEVQAENDDTAGFKATYAALAGLGVVSVMAEADVLKEKLGISEPIEAVSDTGGISLDELESQLLSDTGDDADETDDSVEIDNIASEDSEESDSESLEDVAEMDDVATMDDLEADLALDEPEGDDGDDNLDIDFDLSDIDLNAEPEEPVAEAAGGTDDDYEGIDFDLSDSSESESAEVEEAADNDAFNTEVDPLADDLDLDAAMEMEPSLDGDTVQQESADEQVPDDLSAELAQIDLDTDDSLADTDEDQSLELDIDLDTGEDSMDAETTDFSAESLAGEEAELADEFSEEYELDVSMDDLQADIESTGAELDALVEGNEPEVANTDADADVPELADASIEADEPELAEAAMDAEPAEPEDGFEQLVEASEEGMAEVEEVVSDAEDLLTEPAEPNDTKAADDVVANITDELDADFDTEEDFDFLAGTDETATKLDLARAYIDMGDTEGARDILEEVANEGSDSQQQEAKGLLDSLT